MVATPTTNRILPFIVESAGWHPASARPLDADGPVSRPYVPTGVDFAERPIFEHFAAAAARYPDRMAVSDGSLNFVYAELLQAVRRLARGIAGLTPEGA